MMLSYTKNDLDQQIALKNLIHQLNILLCLTNLFLIIISIILYSIFIFTAFE